MLTHTRHSTSCTADSQYSLTDNQAEFQVTHYVPMIKAIARPYLKHLPASLELDDLVSAGMCGLLEARTRFDVSRGIAFESFAKYRIRGAILDEIRQMSWVSRGALQNIRLVKKTEAALTQQYGEYPTMQQVANQLGKTTPWVDTIKQHSQKVIMQRLSWPNQFSDKEAKLSTSSEHTPLELYEKKEQTRVIQEALNALPPAQSRILFQYYFSELPMNVIGKHLGITESRISQIHSCALAQLRMNQWTSPLRTSWGNVA